MEAVCDATEAGWIGKVEAVGRYGRVGVPACGRAERAEGARVRLGRSAVAVATRVQGI
jgi:hypothetical protein